MIEIETIMIKILIIMNIIQKEIKEIVSKDLIILIILLIKIEAIMIIIMIYTQVIMKIMVKMKL